MKRIKSTNDLPKSFSLTKYDGLEHLSDSDLLEQLSIRVYVSDIFEFNFENAEMRFGNPDFFLESGSEFVIPEIQAIKASNKNKERLNEIYPPILTLDTGWGVTPMTRGMLTYLNFMEAQYGYGKGNSLIKNDFIAGVDADKQAALNREPINLLLDALKNQMFIGVDLSLSNEILIKNFTRMLNIWRGQLQLQPQKKPFNNQWSVARKKIIEYKLIPLLDLKYWEKVTGNVISVGVYVAALFPYGEQDSNSFKQVIMKNLLDITTKESIEKFRAEISK
ncbi:hypothetical protein E0X36_22260 [Salmonella enterica subsp. enterica serovar Gambia]|nr:hypothetical protein [Salmonella enterica subsp. enterica serovar Gambia]